MVFDANEFLKRVAEVKKFWFSSKLNNLRIEAHNDTKQIHFISIDRTTGLETVVVVPAHISEDAILHAKTIISFYRAVEILQEMNVGKKKPLQLRIVPVQKDKQHFSLQVALTHLEFAATAE